MLKLRPDGTGTFADEEVRWTFQQEILSLAKVNGATYRYHVAMGATSMTLTSSGLSQPVIFHRVPSGSPGVAAPSQGPAGLWEVQGPQGTVRLTLNPDGSGVFNTEPIRWTYAQNHLSLTGSDGETIMFIASLTPTSLTLSGATLPQPITFQRAGASPSPGMAGVQGGARGGEGLVGTWQGPNGSVQIHPDGTLVAGGETYRYTAADGVLTLSGSEGILQLPYRLDGQTLIVLMQGQMVTFTRATGGMPGRAGGESAMASTQELVGKWCYVASLSNLGGSSVRTSEECFTLHPNGTYEYYRESSSSGRLGGYGDQGSWGVGSQSSDSGTWRVVGNAMQVQSRAHGSLTFALEKRNHPKNNDPMLCLDGQCYVTFFQKPPWR